MLVHHAKGPSAHRSITQPNLGLTRCVCVIEGDQTFQPVRDLSTTYMNSFRPLLIFLAWLSLGPSCHQIPKKERLSPIQPTDSRYLIKDSTLYELFTVDESGISIFASPEDRLRSLPEIKIYPEEYPYLRRAFASGMSDSLLAWYEEKGTKRLSVDQLRGLAEVKPAPRIVSDSLLPLAGLRIAIDPGHTAGKLAEAERERRYVKMRPSVLTQQERIYFWEANLTLGTGHLIRRQLEALGATVMMTRTEAGKGVLGMGYEAWKETEWESVMAEEIAKEQLDSSELDFWREEATEEEIMQRFFTMQDLRLRAEAINAFRPDLTLIIHFNIHGTNWEDRDAEGFFLPETANYLMSFVPGSFMEGELATTEDRMHLLRMLLTEDIERSIAVSGEFIRQSNQLTGVPIISPDEDIPYLHRSSIPTNEAGVYARNLSLTRLVHGPVIYGESFCQDNINEAIALNKKDVFIKGIWVSSRLRSVADAYVAAVKAFAE